MAWNRQPFPQIGEKGRFLLDDSNEPIHSSVVLYQNSWSFLLNQHNPPARENRYAQSDPTGKQRHWDIREMHTERGKLWREG